MTFKTWVKGLAASIISSASTAILSSGIANASGSPLNWSQLGSIAASSALVGGLLYLQKSPIPDADVTTVTSTTTVSTPKAEAVDEKKA